MGLFTQTLRFLLGGMLLTVCCSSFAIDITINGLNNDDIEDNIVLFIEQVSPPVSEFDVDDYEQKIIVKAAKAIQAFGYYNASITVLPVTYAAKGEFSLTLDVTLEQVTVVNRVILQSDYVNLSIGDQQRVPLPIRDLIKRVRAMQDKPLDHSVYDRLKEQLNTFALLYGYFDFTFILHKLIVEPNEGDTVSNATVHWIFNLGERYMFGDTKFLQDTRGQGIAQKVRPFQRGEFFDQSKIGQYSINLASTGYFENAIARANAGDSVDRFVPVELILKPKPRDLYQFGVGFSTDTKARVSVDWQRPWVNFDGHSLAANLYVSNPRKSLSVDYSIPKANPLNDFLNYRISAQQTDENQTQSDNVTFEILRQWGAEKENEWDKIGFLAVEQESFIQGLQERQSTSLVMPGVTFNRTRKDGDIFVNWGDRQQLTIQGASRNILSDIDFLKVLVKTKWIRQYNKHRFTIRGEAGAISTNDFSRVPATQRFFAGGDQSIRGFGFNEVSEIEQVLVDDELVDELIGGQYLAVASVEYAYNITEKWRGAVFFDAGSANNEFAQGIATGIGIGAHWLSPIGNVSLYIASGSSSVQDDDFQVHIVIGPGL